MRVTVLKRCLVMNTYPNVSSSATSCVFYFCCTDTLQVSTRGLAPSHSSNTWSRLRVRVEMTRLSSSETHIASHLLPPRSHVSCNLLVVRFVSSADVFFDSDEYQFVLYPIFERGEGEPIFSKGRSISCALSPLWGPLWTLTSSAAQS